MPAPVSKGQPIGKLKVWRGDNLVLEVPLQAAEDVGTGTLSQRAIDAATELMIGLFRAGVISCELCRFARFRAHRAGAAYIALAGATMLHFVCARSA